MSPTQTKVNHIITRRFFCIICVLFSIFSSSLAFCATHTAILKITNPNSTASDTPVLDSDGAAWTQVYVEIPARLYMEKGWLDGDLDNLRFIDVDSGNIPLAYWVPAKEDSNLKINHLGLWLLVKDLNPGETETIKMEMVDGGSFVANPRATSDQVHDRTEYGAVATVFPFYGYDSWEWKWNKTNTDNPYSANTKFINNTLYSEDDLWGDAKSGDDAKTGNEFTITIHDLKFYKIENSSLQLYFLSQAAHNKPGKLKSKLGYRLFLTNYKSASDDNHYDRYKFTIRLQQYDGSSWVNKAKAIWKPYNNSRHIFDIKVSQEKIFLVIDGRQCNFIADGGTVSDGKYLRSDDLTSGHFGYDRRTWRKCCGTDINYFTLRRFLEKEPTYEVYGNADLIITDTAAAETIGQDVVEIAPDLQQFSRSVDGNSMDDYIFSTYAIARQSQIIDSYQIKLKNRSTSSTDTFTWDITDANPDQWAVYFCDADGTNCTRTMPTTTELAAGASKTYTIKFVPTLSALVNGSSEHLDIKVTATNDASFDSVRFSASTFANLGCFWGYKAKQVITWPGGHGYDDLLNYQVRVKLSGENDLIHALPNGADVVITDDHNNILDFWLKSFDRDNGNLEAWVKVPKLFKHVSGSEFNIYVWWGNKEHSASRSDKQATFDMFEDWQQDYADDFRVGCDDGTRESTAQNNKGDSMSDFSCEGVATDPHGWENIPTADDYYNWWETDTIAGTRILQADVSSAHKSGDKGPFIHRGGMGWDHYEVAYKIYTGTYDQYNENTGRGNPEYNPVFFNDAGNMWGLEYFANKFIFRPYAAGIDYAWVYQSNVKALLGDGDSFPKKDSWYQAKACIYKDRNTGSSRLKVYLSQPKDNPDDLPDIDSSATTDFTLVADFEPPQSFTLDYGGIGFGGWDSGFGFDDIRVRKYVEDDSGKEPQVTNGTVATNEVRPELTLSTPQITAPIFGGRPAYVEIKATPFSWRGDLQVYYADCYVNGECKDGENATKLGTIGVYGSIDDDRPKGTGFFLLKRDPGTENPASLSSTDRTIYTTDGASTTLKPFALSECANLKDALGTNGTCDADDNVLDDTEKLIRFVRGYYVAGLPRSDSRNFDADSDYGNSDGTPDVDEQWKLGDALHSSPLLVGVPNMSYGAADYWSDFVDTHDERPLCAYFMTNDGMLHAIKLAEKDTTGYRPTDEAKEIWAFIPHAVLPKLKETTDSEHEYVADGLLRAIDIKSDIDDGNGEQWRTVLFGLGGRENTYLFCMDITDPEEPKLLWEMDEDNAKRIGTTISSPALGRIDADNDGTLDKWVAVVGSGYDMDYLKNYESSTAWLTCIDLTDGTILKQVKVSDKVGNALTNLTVLRNASTAEIEKLYFGDYYGCLWRVSGDRIGRTDDDAPLKNGDTLSDSISDTTTVCDLLYKPSDYASSNYPDDPDYPITAQPRIAKGVGDDEYWIYVGTGDYDEYEADYPYQAFLGIKDRDNTQPPYEISDMVDVTFSNATNAAASSWYIQLGKNQDENPDSDALKVNIDYKNATTTGETSSKNRNERVMKPAEVYGGFVFFTTFEPTNEPCGGGKSRFYAVNYRTGVFKSGLFLNLTDSSGGALKKVRSVELETGGVPSQPMIMEGQSGGGTAVASGVTTSSSGGIEKVDLNPQAFSTALDILLWREKR